MSLYIGWIYYPVLTLGPGRRVGIWTAGCGRECPGCISPALQKTENGRLMTTEEIVRMIRALPEQPEGFTVSGGEPFLNPKGLKELLQALRQINDDILVFTGYTYTELTNWQDRDVQEALEECAVLVEGPYEAELNDGIGLRGSSNQKILVFRHHDRYSQAEQWARELQNISYGEKFLTIGIP